MMRTRLVSVVAVAGLVVGLAACGSSGEDAQGGSGSSGDDFVTQINALCADFNATVDDLDPLTALDSTSDDAAFDADAESIDAMIQAATDMKDQVDQLDIPADQADTVQAFVGPLDENRAALTDFQDAIHNHDLSGIQEAAQQLDAVDSSGSDAASSQLVDLGATDCHLSNGP